MEAIKNYLFELGQTSRLGRKLQEQFPETSSLREIPNSLLLALDCNPKLNVFIKDETTLPASASSKARAASWMLAEGIRSGRIREDREVFEASSGNTGAALAFYAGHLQLMLRLFVPETATPGKLEKIRKLGQGYVEVEVVNGNSEAARRAAAAYSVRSPESVWLNQYDNLANPMAHLRHSAPELWEQTDGTVTHFIAGCGSGATLLGHRLAFGEEVSVIGVEPEGSCHQLDGLKNIAAAESEGLRPGSAHLELLDTVFQVSDEAAHSATRLLAQHDLLFGPSTGANLIAFTRIADQLTSSDTVVMYGHDGLDLYLEKYPSLNPSLEQAYVESA